MNYCQTLATKQWRSSCELSPALFSWTKYDKMKGMSLLHLAAILGYTRLVTALLSWRSENPNIILDTEIDALNQDNEGYTPLVSSSVLFHALWLKYVLHLNVVHRFHDRCGHVLRATQILQSPYANGIWMHWTYEIIGSKHQLPLLLKMGKTYKYSVKDPKCPPPPSPIQFKFIIILLFIPAQLL